MSADQFLRPDMIFIFVLGLIAFMISTASGILIAKFMNLFLKDDKKIKSLAGAVGVSRTVLAGIFITLIGGWTPNPVLILLLLLI
jgi:oxaloacetate decarboxylase beta subunit